MARVLYALNMGGNIYGEDVKMSDMPTYRTRIAFMEKDGKAVTGDVSAWRIHQGGDFKKPVIRLGIAPDLGYEGAMRSSIGDIECEIPAHWRYTHYQTDRRIAVDTGLDYTRAGVLAWVNGLLPANAEKYDRIEFTDDHAAWEKTADVAAVYAEQERINAEIMAKFNAVKENAERIRREQIEAYRQQIARARKIEKGAA